MPTGKDEVRALLERLPDGCSLEDIRYHIGVLATVQQRLRSVDTQPHFSQQEAEARLAKWLRRPSDRR